MNAILPADIVVELESAIAGCPPDRCARMLLRMTDLLVAGRDRLREQEIHVLDQVLIRLAEHIEPRALARLSAALTDLKLVPKENLVASLSALSAAPIEIIERVMADAAHEGLVMACHASRLNWQTTSAILHNRGGPPLSTREPVRAPELFEAQHLSTSQWMVRWGDVAAGSRRTKGKNSGAK
ncbi:DUF2336 domain-containing protein [Bradyrhizobium guangdongense]